jgi:EF-P beta-lysylation protein EpmB
VGDLSAMPVPGVLHKYHGRVLLVLTGACAIHCRYCFRRQFPYSEANPIRENWQHALQYIENDSTINEVILSGGDPLLLEDHRLVPLVNALAEIPHLKRLRIHTRLPIVLPERITNDLIQLLSTNRLQTIMVIHTNHANEINDVISQALHKLHKNNITLLNQAVLLKNINDSTAIQAELCERLFANNVTPYYLHLLDKVNGSAHFDVDLEAGISISQELRTQLPGYLVPRLVKEQAGKDSKTPAELLIP